MGFINKELITLIICCIALIIIGIKLLKNYKKIQKNLFMKIKKKEQKNNKSIIEKEEPKDHTLLINPSDIQMAEIPWKDPTNITYPLIDTLTDNPPKEKIKKKKKVIKKPFNKNVKTKKTIKKKKSKK
jgi:hypothetical protein